LFDNAAIFFLLRVKTVLCIDLQATERVVACACILIKVIGNLIIEFKPSEKARMRVKKYLLVDERGLRRESGSGLLCVFLLNRDHIRGTYSAHFGP